jgi:uncharacterized membrane protein YraQ (UPF0718 family)
MQAAGENAHPHRPSFRAQCLRAVNWGFYDLGLPVTKYIFYGILVATTIFLAVPASFVAAYLGNPGLLSYGSTVLLGAAMYVCSVGHIPVVAALIAMGANPGVALTFLLSGVATNLPELVSISRLLRLRVALLYAGGLICVSVLAGILVNVLPVDVKAVLATQEPNPAAGIARSITIVVPDALARGSAFFILALGAWSASLSLYEMLLTAFRRKR